MTLTQSLISIFETYTIASAIGGLSYAAVKFVRKVCPNSSGEVLTLLVGFPSIIFTLLMLGALGVAMVAGALICIATAWAEKAIDREGRSFKFHYATVLTATALSYNLCVLFAVSLIPFLPQGNDWALIAFFLGLLFGSSAVPLLVWMFQTAKLRPGIDRQLMEGEVTDR